MAWRKCLSHRTVAVRKPGEVGTDTWPELLSEAQLSEQLLRKWSVGCNHRLGSFISQIIADEK